AILKQSALRINPFFVEKQLSGRMSVGNTSGRRAVVAMVNRIDAPHRPLASLLFKYVRDESWRARDHENAVERCGIHSQVGENGAGGAAHVAPKRLRRGG